MLLVILLENTVGEMWACLGSICFIGWIYGMNHGHSRGLSALIEVFTGEELWGTIRPHRWNFSIHPSIHLSMQASIPHSIHKPADPCILPFILVSIYPVYCSGFWDWETQKRDTHPAFIKTIKYNTNHAVSGRKKPKPNNAKEGK